MGEIRLSLGDIHSAEAKIAALHESGNLTPAEHSAFVAIFDFIAQPRIPQPEEIMIEADLQTQFENGLMMIGKDAEHFEMKQAMEDIGRELTNYLLRERFIIFKKYAPSGQKPRLRGMLLAHRPPEPKKVPYVKPKPN